MVSDLNLIKSAIFTDLFNPQTVQTLNIVIQEQLHMQNITEYLIIITVFFTGLRMLAVLFGQREFRFQREYVGLSIANFMILIFCIILSYFAVVLETQRFLHLTFLHLTQLLAPFAIIGFITIFKVLPRITAKIRAEKSTKDSFAFISVFFAIFLLFNSGVVYSIVGKHTGTATVISTEYNYDYAKFNDKEVTGVKWLHSSRINESICAEEYRSLLTRDCDEPYVNKIFLKIIPHLKFP